MFSIRFLIYFGKETKNELLVNGGFFLKSFGKSLSCVKVLSHLVELTFEACVGRFAIIEMLMEIDHLQI